MPFIHQADLERYPPSLRSAALALCDVLPRERKAAVVSLNSNTRRDAAKEAR